MKSISVMLLPKDFPAVGDVPLRRNYQWSDPSEAVPEVMALATPVSIEWIPAEREFSNLQSFKFNAETGRALLVTVKHGLKSFGDYPLVKDYAGVIRAEPFPKTVKVVSQGSLLSLSGDKKISVLTRGVGAMQFEVSRLLPGSVSHLVSQSEGTFSNPQFWSMYGSRTFGFDDLSEVFREVRQLPVDPTGKNQYTVFDFAPLLSNGALPRGLFYLRIREWNVADNTPMPGGAADARLIMLTDLGVLAKDSADGSHDIFVQSIRNGTPVVDAQVEILGKNGLAILSQKTNAEGRATFPTLKDFKHDKTPTVYVVQKEGDFSFLPYNRPDRKLNLSRFDTGGVYTVRPELAQTGWRYRPRRGVIATATENPPPAVSSSTQNESLQAYLFSDRGIYRPGDTIHIGLIVKPMDWKPLPPGLPLQVVVSDPRGVEIRSEMVKFSPAGFEEFSTVTQEDSPTGSYEFLLYLVRADGPKVLLGSTSVRVEDFQPDRMTIKAALSVPGSAGWISPDALSANVTLRNLFGTPAAGRRVKGSFKLTPSAAFFPGYADYQFVDPYKTNKSYDEHLGEVMTDADGRAKFDFKLERFDKGLFRLRFIAEGFEPEGGRSVLADAVAVVSPAPYLVAYKADGDLGYIDKGSRRQVHIIAVNPKLARIAVPDLTIELLEIRYVSVLTRQENGTLAFQSVRKEISKEKKTLALPAAGQTLTLPSAGPGSYVYAIRNQKGDELNRIYFDIVGHANVSRSLEREAELKIKLDKPQYAPGEEAELDIQAPYVGAGLITVERDRIYNARWFTTTTTESVQKIRIPDELEGNGYITVTFVRALDSHEIFTSPLSYGVASFSINLARRTQQVKLDTPALVRPGDTLTIGYQAAANTRLVLIAVDEGILQVARYKTPDPLSYFFRKRALEVSTSQILDLILPELHLLNESSATGGDQGKLLARSHNPFKRKGQKPVAFWSGLIDSDGKPGSVDVPVPDYFNGTVRVMAIAVSDDTVGVAEKSVVSQGYFVIQPQAPYFVAPGDQFEVTALVANNLKGAKNAADVTVALHT
ncbi:MAG TPA: MG2 domain-containing protein, partial [Candidatus Binataceae bacterium]|nr:MG2 domain-containing protein [Candidatus Binataceae bacterium]